MFSAGSHPTSFATSASIASGEVVEAQRLTTLPSLLIKNFSKFHCKRHTQCVSLAFILRREPDEVATYLDPREPQEARLLVLEVLVYLVRVVTIDIRLLHKGKFHAMVELTK
jgi:hypothetical protein